MFPFSFYRGHTKWDNNSVKSSTHAHVLGSIFRLAKSDKNMHQQTTKPASNKTNKPECIQASRQRNGMIDKQASQQASNKKPPAQKSYQSDMKSPTRTQANRQAYLPACFSLCLSVSSYMCTSVMFIKSALLPACLPARLLAYVAYMSPPCLSLSLDPCSGASVYLGMRLPIKEPSPQAGKQADRQAGKLAGKQ